MTKVVRMMNGKKNLSEEEKTLIEKVIWLIEDSYPDTNEWPHDRLVRNVIEDLDRRKEELDRMFEEV